MNNMHKENVSLYVFQSFVLKMSSQIKQVTICVTLFRKNRLYATLHVWNKMLMHCEKTNWPSTISLVSPTATIHTTVTNSSQLLMESIKLCKYLQDKRAWRQSIPIYRTMEGSSVAMFQVREINKVSFG